LAFSLLKKKKNTTSGDSTGERMASEASTELAPSESLFQTILLGTFLVGLPILIYAIYYKSMFMGLINSNAFDYAQLARNLSQGRGFTTYFLRPLALTHGDNVFRQPDLVHTPLFPVILAMGFVLRGASDAIASYTSGLFYLITVPMVYWFGLRVFSKKVGVIGALIFMANPLVLEYSVSGLPITLEIFLVTSLLFVIYGIAEQSKVEEGHGLPVAQLLLCGGLTGALYLTDCMFLYVIPVIFVAIVSLTRGKWAKSIPCFIGAILITVAPWMVRTGLLTGNPFFGLRGMEVWMGTRGYYPGSLAYRTMPADLLPGVGLYKAVVQKILLGAGEVVQQFPQVSASWMLAFLLPSLLFRFRDQAVHIVRRVMMYCFLGILVGMLPFGVELPLFAPLIPVMLIFAIAYLLQLVEQSRLPKSSMMLLTALLTGAILLPLLRDVVLIEKPQPPIGIPSARHIKDVAGKEDVVLTDQPWLVAWYGNRPSVWIPAVDGNLKAYKTRFANLRWLFLTEQVVNFSPEWQQVYSEFYRWSLTYVQAKNSNKIPPAMIVVNASTDSIPVVEALNGFMTLEPISGSPPSVVVATMPK
jgi:4-amino-4-deoxy-L-arabinose transferase-like glycosyltransferase